MTHLAPGLCLSLLAFGVLSLLLSLALRPLIRRAATGLWTSEALLALRFAPTAFAALVAGGVLLPAFLRFEPRDSSEEIGWAMLLPAAAALAMIAAGALRGARALVAARRLQRRLAAGALAIDLPGAPAPAFAIDHEFPLVALVGVFRPRLFVARRVLEMCTPDEFAAILAHEAGHLERRDNLRQLLVRSCPDLLAFTAAGARLEDAWEEACDRAADDRGARGGRRDDLAAALVKVARAVPGPLRTAAIPYMAFSRSDAVAVRVRRLLDEPSGNGRPFARRGVPLSVAAAAAAAAAGLVSGWDTALYQVHAVAETVVRLLQ
jgi:Zn-dependent protease with chaperone function